jgi:hypothetical protein
MMSLLIDYLKPTDMLSNSSVICLQCGGGIVDRNVDSKFYVPQYEYASLRYPYYCAGPAYTYPTHLANYLYEISEYVKYVRMEDAYFGLLMEKLKEEKIQNISINNIIEKYNEIYPKGSFQRKDYFDDKKHFFHFHIDDNDHYSFIFNKLNRFENDEK